MIRGIHWSNRGGFSRKVSKNRPSFQEEIHKALFVSKENYKIGDFVNVTINSCTS
jgi:hypothetical protein